MFIQSWHGQLQKSKELVHVLSTFIFYKSTLTSTITSKPRGRQFQWLLRCTYLNSAKGGAILSLYSLNDGGVCILLWPPFTQHFQYSICWFSNIHNNTCTCTYLVHSVLPNEFKGYWHSMSSVLAFLWCGNGARPIALQDVVSGSTQATPSQYTLLLAWGGH